jgi:hypothetical protein
MHFGQPHLLACGRTAPSTGPVLSVHRSKPTGGTSATAQSIKGFKGGSPRILERQNLEVADA